MRGSEGGRSRAGRRRERAGCAARIGAIGAVSALRARWRRAALALATALGRRRGIFIPYRYADAVAAPPAYPALAAAFAAAEPRFVARLAQAQAHLPRLGGFVATRPPEPRFDQDWFPRLDAAMAYTLVRDGAPRRIVEIGSGHSTRFLARAVRDGGLAAAITAIDPAPRAPLDGLAISFLRKTLQDAGAAPFAALAAGDVLFVDSSHVLVPGSDVDLVLNAVLPALPRGVLVHVHDVFLPDGYPADWAWRGYNEQNALAPLIATGAYELLWASHYVATRLAAAVAEHGLDALPLKPGARESSLWLRKT